MPQPFKGSYVEKFGMQSRREDPAAYQRAWNAEHREEVRAYHREYYRKRMENPDFRKKHNQHGVWTRRKTKYGITKEQYEALLTAQDGRCIICAEIVGNQLRVDHDHETGEIRGLLCNECNAGLGMFHDDPKLLSNAIAYLGRKRQNRS